MTCLVACRYVGVASQPVGMQGAPLRDAGLCLACSLLDGTSVFHTWGKDDVVSVGRRVHRQIGWP